MHGFFRTAAAVPKSAVSNVERNSSEIISLIGTAREKGADLVVFPELCITGKHCGDLFRNNRLLEKSEEALAAVSEASHDIISVVGLPLKLNGLIYNCAAVISDKRILGIVPKDCESTEEARWFSSLKNNGEALICGESFPLGNHNFHSKKGGVKLKIGFGLSGACSGADITALLASDSAEVGASGRLETSLLHLSESTASVIVYAGSGIFESTAEKVYDGSSFIAEYGNILAKGSRYNKDSYLCVTDVDLELISSVKRSKHIKSAQTDTICFNYVPKTAKKLFRTISKTPFIPDSIIDTEAYFHEIYNILKTGIYKKLMHTGIRKSIIGVSGGLDSTLALLALAEAYDFAGFPREDIIAVSMPGFGTSGRTYNNAVKLMRSLGVTARIISIKEACLQHFSDIGLSEDDKSLAYENSQARERTQILMDIASAINGIVMGTGDMSEAALGFCTYNGDQMSMYCINGGIPKTMISPLLRYASENNFENERDLLLDIIATPISPELLPADENNEVPQKTESIVGPYELNDFFMYYLIKHGFSDEKIAYLAACAFKNKYGESEINSWLKCFTRRFVQNHFKRQTQPDSPQVFDISLSPRSGFIMSCDTDAGIWN